MKDPLVIERTFNVKSSRLWKAITDKEEMKAWYFDLTAFKPEVGFEFTFTGRSDVREYVHLCRITEVIPGKKITYSWKYEGFEGVSYVTFELFDEGAKTRLKLTHEGLETFPREKDFSRESFTMGWTELIGNSLKKHVEGEN